MSLLARAVLDADFMYTGDVQDHELVSPGSTRIDACLSRLVSELDLETERFQSDRGEEVFVPAL